MDLKNAVDIVQLALISLPTLYIGVAVNRYQKTAKLMELINSLKTSLFSNDEDERNLAFSLIFLLPDKRMARLTVDQIPKDKRFLMLRSVILTAVETGNKNVLNTVMAICPYYKQSLDLAIMFKDGDVEYYGDLTDLVAYRFR